MKQAEALDILKMGKNVFLTGAAGSGKTHVLREYITYLQESGAKVGVTASTGIAATHMNGMTIHSWSGIGVRDNLDETELAKILKRHRIKKNFQYTEVLIIDEISMLGAGTLDMVDQVCRAAKSTAVPFGGMQVVFSGDFFQLPPISRERQVEFAYMSEAWREADLTVCYLDEQFRQEEDDPLLSVLRDMRERDVTEDTLNHLRGRYRAPIEGPVQPTRLYTHNIDVDAVNARELAKLEGEVHEYHMSGTGNKQALEYLKRSCLAPELLQLTVGATVMFVKNNYDKGYVNGTLGVIVDFDELDYPVVQIRDGHEIIATPESWAIDDDGKSLAAVTQVPLRLAWAITVHKSQGMSLDAVEMDLSKAFTPGMGYVALSRVRTLAGLRLLGFNHVASEVSETVYENDLDLRKSSEIAVDETASLAREDRVAIQKDFIRSIAREAPSEKKSTFEITKELVEKGRTIEEVSLERKLTIGTVLSHLETLRDNSIDVVMDHLKPEDGTFEAIEKVFEKIGSEKLAPVRNKLGRKYSYEDIRTARLFWKKK